LGVGENPSLEVGVGAGGGDLSHTYLVAIPICNVIMIFSRLLTAMHMLNNPNFVNKGKYRKPYYSLIYYIQE
jgi:hypothetical protein